MKRHSTKSSFVKSLVSDLTGPLLAGWGWIIAAQIGVSTTGSASWKDWEVVWESHSDIAIGYNQITDTWAIDVGRGDFGEQGAALLPAENTIILAGPETSRTVPENIPDAFSFLGDAGDTYYLFPFSEPPANSRILYLGSNGYRIPQGIFVNNQVRWKLADHAGPGDFFLYQASGGSATIFMDSRPSETPYGPGYQEISGGHSHFNWVFRAPGIYLLSFQAGGNLLSGGETSSDEIPFFFLVDPKPVEWWLVDQFRKGVKSSEVSLIRDASGDGNPNLLAYAFGYSPFGPATGFLPEHELVQRDGQNFLSLFFRQPVGDPNRDDRSDLIYRVQSSSNLVDWTDITDEAAWKNISPDADETPRVRVTDIEPIEQTSRRFLRLVVDYQP